MMITEKVPVRGLVLSRGNDGFANIVEVRKRTKIAMLVYQDTYESIGRLLSLCQSRDGPYALIETMESIRFRSMQAHQAQMLGAFAVNRAMEGTLTGRRVINNIQINALRNMADFDGDTISFTDSWVQSARNFYYFNSSDHYHPTPRAYEVMGNFLHDKWSSFGVSEVAMARSSYNAFRISRHLGIAFGNYFSDKTREDSWFPSRLKLKGIIPTDVRTLTAISGITKADLRKDNSLQEKLNHDLEEYSRRTPVGHPGLGFLQKPRQQQPLSLRFAGIGFA